MVRRIVALLLLGAWQLQGAVPPHIHAGMSAKHLIAHGERRHFHRWGGPQSYHDHAHQHAHHEAARRALDQGHSSGDFAVPPMDHDHDAVYLADGSLVNESDRSLELAPLDVATFAACVGEATPSLEQHTSAPPRYGGQPPAFLSTTRLLL